MTYKGKGVKVVLLKDANSQLNELIEVVNNEIARGIKTDNQVLLNSIKQKIEFLRLNPAYGFHIPRNRIPKKYISKFGINNLWKINLSGAWRLIYTLKGNEIEIIALVLDILNHYDYDKKFEYTKR